ncbi:MAG TPA: hemolysin III family protein [Actinomycetales bacterium]|nr:hemolysin III family protein [Actinomycetales bacterium]
MGRTHASGLPQAERRRSRPEERGTNPVSATAEQLAATAEQVSAAADRVIQAVKPHLRGWIHTVTAPLAFAACIVLIVLTPAGYRWTTTVFGISSVVLFAMSAVYHRGHWGPRTMATLRRLDHSNIFLLIAGTYTPLSWILLERPTALLVLGIVWGGAIAGIILKVFWLRSPRWLYVPIYVALGWVAVWFLPHFRNSGSDAIMWLVISGGIAYTLGALAYAFKWPNPSPRWFGFHEVFHAGTVIGWVCHYIAAMMSVISLW